jgi:hypothetical protein
MKPLQKEQIMMRSNNANLKQQTSGLKVKTNVKAGDPPPEVGRHDR